LDGRISAKKHFHHAIHDLTLALKLLNRCRRLKRKDVLRFLGTMNLPKLWNAGLVMSSFYIAKWQRKPIQWGLPFNVSIEPTTSCNLGCPECPSGLKIFTRDTGQLSMEMYDKTLVELGDTLIYLYFYFQGEPYMHPRFTDLVQKAKAKNIYTVTSTNAHFLTERKAAETVASGLDRIIISIDGSTQEVYEQYRKNGSLEKVIAGTKALVKAKQEAKSHTPHILFQCILFKQNESQIEDIKRLGKELGVDEVIFKTAQIYDYKNGHDLIPENDAHSRYRKQPDGTYVIKNALENHCWKLWHSCVITWDGWVVPCCFDKDAQYRLGSLQEKSFRVIWESDLYTSFRERILQSRKDIDICTNCTEGLKVWTSE